MVKIYLNVINDSLVIQVSATSQNSRQENNNGDDPVFLCKMLYYKDV